MSEQQQQATITAERQVAAHRVASVFNSLQQFLETLKHETETGEKLMSEHLRNAHARIEEAGTWAVKHVLTFGPPPTKAAPEAPAETPAPIGMVDAATPVGADALPPTTPTESM